MIFDVNEEPRPKADLVIYSINEGALIDGLTADKVKAGDEREIKQMKELQLAVLLGQGDGHLTNPSCSPGGTKCDRDVC